MKFSGIILLVITGSLSCFPLILQAQDPGPNPDIGVPFDAGLSILIAAGVGYAIKKRYDQKKKDQQPTTPDDINL